MIARGSALMAAAAAACTLLAGGVALAAKDDIILVTRATDGGAAVDSSGFPSISADGRYVAFESDADNLSTEDNNAYDNVFVRDLLTQTTILASRATGTVGAAGDSFSKDASMSADGRYVAFSSEADNLSPDDNNGVRNVFVRDLQANTTEFVSRAPDGGAADSQSRNPTLSADGRFVAFASDADNLSSFDDNSVPNVFVRDRQLGTTTHVGPTRPYPTISRPPISADGRLVAFDSDADDLSTEDNNAVANVYVRDLQAGTTTYVSRATGGAAGDGDSQAPAMSADGRFVAFQSFADNLSAEDDNAIQVFVRDRQTGTTALASQASGGDADAPAISGHGRYVAFTIYPDNDLPGDIPQLFVRDMQSPTTTLVSRASGPSGAVGDGGSGTPAFSADGRFVAFVSNASNLSDADNDNTADIFVRDLLGGPPPGGGDTDAPRLTGASMKNRRFRVGRKPTPVFTPARRRPAPRSTSFRYTLSERATVTIAIARAAGGVKLRKGRKRATCVLATRSNRRKLRGQLLRQGIPERLLERALARRRCIVYRRAGTLTRAGQGPGRVETPFSGRIGRRALKPGRFRAILRAIDGAGNRSASVRIGFTISG